MADKVQKIKEWISKEQNGLMDAQGNFEYPEHEGAYNILCNLDAYIDSLQEEPVSLWHDANEETPTQGSNILMFRKEEKDANYPPIAGCFHGTSFKNDNKLYWGYYNGFCYNEIEPPVKWAYIDDILNLSNIQRTVKDWKEPVSEDLKKAAHEYANLRMSNYKTAFYAFMSGAQWKEKEMQSTIELAEDHAMLAGMNKMKEEMMENIWKPADGDDLPEIDREVIALLDNGRVVFAHRPPEYWDGKNIITGKVTRNYPKTYDKGGWNIPDIKFWLDVELPKEIEL